MDSILWGALAALALKTLAASPLLRAAGLAGAGVLMIVLLRDRNPAAPTPVQLSLGLASLAITATLVVVEVACRPDSRIVSLLECLPLRAVGKVSYGMYLLHFQMIELGWPLALLLWRTDSVHGFFLSFGLLSGLTYLAAALLYRYVERPFLVLKEKRFAA
jgi:peptidoglycan/LPS O-acetylase OafA/YrhL